MNGKTNSSSIINDNDKAVIEVIALTGSVVEFIKSGITVCSLSSGKINGDDNTRSNYYYYVDERNYGDWYIEVTKDNRTEEHIVTVNANKLYIVYATRFYLYYHGYILNEDVTGGIVQDFTVTKFDKTNLTKDPATLNSDHILMDMTTYASSATFRYREVNTYNKIDVTPYSTFKIVFQVTSGTLYAAYFQLCDSKTKAYASADNAAATGSISAHESSQYESSITTDISNVTGEYYFVAYTFFGIKSDSKGVLQIKEIAFEL